MPRTRWLVLSIVALAAVLRLFWIGVGSLDIDEAFSVWVARHPWRDIGAVLARFDDHPALYYIVLHLWMRLAGDHEFALRLLSILCGVVTIPLAYWLGSVVGGRPLGLLTAFLMAVSPENVQWSQEARMYALETLALVFAMCGLAWLLAHPDARAGSPGKHLALGAFVFGTATALWTEYTAVLFPLAAAAVLAYVAWGKRGERRRGIVRDWLPAYAAIGALCFAELSLAFRQVHGANVINWFPVNPLALPSTLLVAAGLIALGRVIWRSEPQWIAFTVGLWAVPILCLILVSLRHPIFTKQTFVWTYVPLYLAVGAGLLHVRRRWAFALLLGAVMVVDIVGLVDHYRMDFLTSGVRGWDRAAEYVASRVRSDDVILFYVPYVQPAFDYYFERAHRPVAEHGIPADFGSGRVLFPPLTDNDAPRVLEAVAGHPRAWFVHGMFPSARVILNALDRSGHLLDSRVVTNALTVYQYAINQRAHP